MSMFNTSKPEVGLLGAERSPAREIGFVGSVKWCGQGSFDTPDRACTSTGWDHRTWARTGPNTSTRCGSVRSPS
ncbi:hypothetical protein [Streptomyces sp. NRRL S-37]|uniref:hypothetical protein n=1 Tax=Streptomyces sp. NRRL S-37 TaxID=1463903 RepID=UPI00131C43B2|nr:hypothetical protein [Streptomyces sp. NRRL S-37]